jgi:hypothetical protein
MPGLPDLKTCCMKKPRAVCLSLLFLVILAGCIFPAKPGSHVWFYTFGTGSGTDTLTPVSFLELRPDGSFSQDFGSYEYGRWEQKDQQLFLTNQQHKTYIYAISNLASGEMALVIAHDRIGHFDGKSLPSADPLEDPYSADNNQWRLPATHKENDAEIRQRLYNHCRFWEKYFAWALDKKLDIVDVRSTPTAIKIYGNGFGLKSFDDLPPRWKALFFDDEDCRKANEILTNIFQHQNIAWSNTDSKYKMFLGAFQQLEKFLHS